MKVVITGYNISNQNKAGGVKVRIKKIYHHLRQRDGLDLEYFCLMTTDLSNCDILHLFKLEPEYYQLVKCAKKLGVIVVLSSIVPLENSHKIDFYRNFLNKFPLLTSQKMAFSILQMVDAIIVETDQEARFIHRHYRISTSKLFTIGNGVDELKYEGKEIYDIIGGEKEYVLQVGRINSNKNYLNVIKALKNQNIDFVIIGDGDHGDRKYYDECIKEANGDPHFHFLGWVDSNSNLLKSAYSNAKVLVVPSFHETFSIVALEGAAAGCNMVITKSLPIHDYGVFDDCHLINPYDIVDIRHQILMAFSEPRTDVTKKRVLGKFSWSNIIDKHIDLYKELYNAQNKKNNTASSSI